MTLPFLLHVKQTNTVAGLILTQSDNVFGALVFDKTTSDNFVSLRNDMVIDDSRNTDNETHLLLIVYYTAILCMDLIIKALS